MSNIAINSAQSALNAYATMLNNTANNVANINTAGYKPLQTNMQETTTGGVTANTSGNAPADSVELTKEVVDMMVAEFGFKANVKMFKTAQETRKSVIDIMA